MTDRSTRQNDPETGLPVLPDGESWYVGLDKAHFIIAIVVTDPETGDQQITNEQAILTTFSGRIIYDLADLTQAVIRDGASKIVNLRESKRMRSLAAQNHAKLLGHYPPNTLEIK